jgi:hypothetical protein
MPKGPRGEKRPIEPINAEIVAALRSAARKKQSKPDAQGS